MLATLIGRDQATNIGHESLRDLLAQLSNSLNTNLYYLSLYVALTIPDMCGALDSTDGRASGNEYVKWFDKHVAPKYRGFLSGEECYEFRCSLLHQGQLRPRKGRYSRMVFVEPAATTNVLHNNIINDALNIDVRLFCKDMIDSAIQWLDQVEGTALFKTNFEKFVRRYPTGLAPYIGGVPVIA
jgi:hypothetical protein